MLGGYGLGRLIVVATAVVSTTGKERAEDGIRMIFVSIINQTYIHIVIGNQYPYNSTEPKSHESGIRYLRILTTYHNASEIIRYPAGIQYWADKAMGRQEGPSIPNRLLYSDRFIRIYSCGN